MKMLMGIFVRASDSVLCVRSRLDLPQDTDRSGTIDFKGEQ